MAKLASKCASRHKSVQLTLLYFCQGFQGKSEEKKIEQKGSERLRGSRSSTSYVLIDLVFDCVVSEKK